METPQIECHTDPRKCSHRITFHDGLTIKPGGQVIVSRDGDNVTYRIGTGPIGSGEPAYGVIGDYTTIMQAVREQSTKGT